MAVRGAPVAVTVVCAGARPRAARRACAGRAPARLSGELASLRNQADAAQSGPVSTASQVRLAPALRERLRADGPAAPCGRPFAWKGTLYLAHWVAFAFPTERMAISSVDEAGGAVRLEHLLSPLPPAVAEAQYTRGQRRTEAERRAAAADPASVREKNWGFAADAERLLVFHALLPCTVVLAFDLRAGALQAGASARVESRACFSGAAAATALATGGPRRRESACRRFPLSTEWVTQPASAKGTPRPPCVARTLAQWVRGQSWRAGGVVGPCLAMGHSCGSHRLVV